MERSASVTSLTINLTRSERDDIPFYLLQETKKENLTSKKGMPRNANTYRRTRRVCNRKLGCVITRKQKQKQQKKQQKRSKTRRIRQRGGKLGLADFLPTTTWSTWAAPDQATQFGAFKSAPPPLANGGMYTGPQSTGPWASTPFPPTQWAHALESATGSAGAKVFEHQKPNDNFGASFSPAFRSNYVARK